MYYNHRYYSKELGRFISVDPNNAILPNTWFDELIKRLKEQGYAVNLGVFLKDFYILLSI